MIVRGFSLRQKQLLNNRRMSHRYGQTILVPHENIVKRRHVMAVARVSKITAASTKSFQEVTEEGL